MARNIRLEQGFSRDGFITDQDCFSSVRYRTIPASDNGCGFIAAYNLRRALGQAVSWEEVRKEMDGLHRLRIPGPTLMNVMRKYLQYHVPGCKEVSGRNEAVSAAEESSAGIFRYMEGHIPHYVSYMLQDDGRFRFFNVAEGLEDCTMTMKQFAEEHLRWGSVIVLCVPKCSPRQSS